MNQGQEPRVLRSRKALLGVARGAVVCEEVVEDAQLDELRARPVQKAFQLVAVRLASASASVELPVRQSSLAAAHVDVVREEDVEGVRLGGWPLWL
ncbi:hypothetical protein PI124_g22492 [Phytophthora idaei]|nr:hypothetical protein PI124_g22492 [Phytophthora idaei]